MFQTLERENAEKTFVKGKKQPNLRREVSSTKCCIIFCYSTCDNKMNNHWFCESGCHLEHSAVLTRCSIPSPVHYWTFLVSHLTLRLDFQVRKRCGSEMLAFLKRWKEAAKLDHTWKDPYKVLNESSGNYHRVRWWSAPSRTYLCRFWGVLEALLDTCGFENIWGLTPLRSSDINGCPRD